MSNVVKWICSLLVASAAIASAQTTGAQDPSARWRQLHFLIGKWTASGDTQLGSAQGATSFEFELDHQIVVRRNSAQYSKGPAAGTKHDDLLILYLDAPNDAPHAIYFDSEGHVIRYNVSFPHADSVVFESDGSQPGPKFRLSYALEGKLLDGKFEMTEPGKPEYKTFLSWKSAKD